MSKSPQMITSPYAPDIEKLRAWLEESIKAVKFMELVTAVIAFVVRLTEINAELTKQLTQLKKKRPRSETLRRLNRQLLLPFMKPMGAPKAEPSQDTGEKTKKRRLNHHGRAKLPAHLERVPRDNPVPPELRICPQCGSEMKTVGHSTCEFLEVIPARVVVIQRRDERVACPHDDTIVSAPTPAQLIERGKLGMTLIVEATADKYIEHLPIERQSLRFRRAGVDIAPQTLGRSVASHLDLVEPIAAAIAERTRGPGLLGTDASSLAILDREAPEGIRTAAIWCWTNARWVSFFYSRTCDSESVREFLGENLRRTVQCDGTNLLTFLEKKGGARPGCWSHGRRGLVEAARLGESLAFDPLREIQKLFAIEKLSRREGDSADRRKARRQEYAKPIIDKLKGWLDEQTALFPPKTPFGKALGYLKRQWLRLCLFLEDGNIELTNNRLERELRKLVLGRKNWLFAWEDVGGERTANILSIIATCVAHNINPRAYLHVVTKLLVGGWPQKRLAELLPDRITDLHPELRLPSPVDERELAPSPPLSELGPAQA
jgi:transposase